MKSGSVRSLRSRIAMGGVGAVLAAALAVSAAAPASAYVSGIKTGTSGSWEAGSGMYLQWWLSPSSAEAHHPGWSHAVQARWNEGPITM